MGEWEPDESLRVEQSDAFLWIVPARVDGRWALREEGGQFEGELDIVQQFQRIGGTLTIHARKQPLLGAYVHGEHIGFTFVGADGGVRSVRARIDGAALSGALRFSGNLSRITGQRKESAADGAGRGLARAGRLDD
jgi:hypothetical protein